MSTTTAGHRSKPSQEEWDFRRSQIIDLYESTTLQKVQQILAADGFNATPKQLRVMLQKWGVQKNIKSEAMEDVLERLSLNELQQRSKDRDISVGDRDVKLSQAKRYLRRTHHRGTYRLRGSSRSGSTVSGQEDETVGSHLYQNISLPALQNSVDVQGGDQTLKSSQDLVHDPAVMQQNATQSLHSSDQYQGASRLRRSVRIFEAQGGEYSSAVNTRTLECVQEAGKGQHESNFACPFTKHDPVTFFNRYQSYLPSWECQQGFSTTRRVKLHLQVIHAVEDQMIDKIINNDPTRLSIPSPNGLTVQQGVEDWYSIWTALFPNAQPPDNPYQETTSDNMVEHIPNHAYTSNSMNTNRLVSSWPYPPLSRSPHPSSDHSNVLPSSWRGLLSDVRDREQELAPKSRRARAKFVSRANQKCIGSDKVATQGSISANARKSRTVGDSPSRNLSVEQGDKCGSIAGTDDSASSEKAILGGEDTNA